MICERKISIKSRIMWCLDIYRNATSLLKQSGKEFVQGLNKKKTWLREKEMSKSMITYLKIKD